MRTAAALRSLAVALLTTAAFSAPSQAQFSIGDPLVPRSLADGFSSFILVSPYSFPVAAIGQIVSSVSIFNGVVGRDFTPLLLQSDGAGNWTITGSGTQRVVGAAGLQTYGFGLTGGSDIVTASTRVGWETGSSGGVILYDNDGDGNLYTYSNNGDGPTAVGATFGTAGVTDRAYAIQFNSSEAVSVTPEPTSVVLTATGFAALIAVGRRRRA